MVPQTNPERSLNGHVSPEDEIDFSDVGPAERTAAAFTAWKAEQQPSWRDREPRHVHSLKWHDADGLEHMHVLRSDDLDDVLKEMATIKLCIEHARSRAATKRQQAAE